MYPSEYRVLDVDVSLNSWHFKVFPKETELKEKQMRDDATVRVKAIIPTGIIPFVTLTSIET